MDTDSEEPAMCDAREQRGPSARLWATMEIEGGWILNRGGF